MHQQHNLGKLERKTEIKRERERELEKNIFKELQFRFI